MTQDRVRPDVNELIGKLASEDRKEAQKALYHLQSSATLKELPSIIRILLAIQDGVVYNEVIEFLGNIKAAGAPAIMIQSLMEPEFQVLRTDLTRACWESQLDYSPHLLLFLHLFMTGDFTLAIEAFSVIENTCLERKVNPGMIGEMLVLLKSSLPDQPETKRRLVLELILVLETYSATN